MSQLRSERGSDGLKVTKLCQEYRSNPFSLFSSGLLSSASVVPGLAASVSPAVLQGKYILRPTELETQDPEICIL